MAGLITPSVEGVVAQPHPQLSALPHLPVLDGVRSLAILSVMLFHFCQHGPPLHTPLLKAVGRVALLGQNGVDLFFVLSGFLITNILLLARQRKNGLRRFYLRRTTRIFPLYYFYLLVAFVFWPALHPTAHVPWSDQWWFWAYAQNVQDTFVSGFHLFGPGHFWSLAVEEHFYLIWPFLVVGLPLSRLKPALFGIVGLALASRALMVWAGYPVFYFTLCRMDALALGAWLALLSRNPETMRRLGIGLRRHSFWLLMVCLPLYVLVSGMGSPLVQVFKFTAVALLCTGFLTLVLTADRASWRARSLASSPAREIAKVSYAMYVFHPALFSLLEPAYSHFPFLLSLLLAFSATFLVAQLSWHLLESPCLRLRDLSVWKASRSLQASSR